METYLITQSLVSSWYYLHDCHDGCEDDAQEEFLNALNRVRKPPTQAMLNGLEFEDECYKCAAGLPRQPHRSWEPGIQKVAEIIQGAPVQIRLKSELTVCGMNFLVYGILDAMKDGTIYDVKFLNKSLGSTEVYGKYLQSAQHPFYFYMVEEADDFKYLVSDGQDLYIERYTPAMCRTASEIIEEFIGGITAGGYLDLYKEKWVANDRETS